VGIAPGKSGLAVLDVDHGSRTLEEFKTWANNKRLPGPTYAVRTGRRVNKDTGEPEFGVQVYYATPEPLDTFPWLDGDHSGEVRSASGHIMAAGSVHPDSGELYEVLVDVTPLPLPDVVRRLPRGTGTGKPGQPNAAVVWDGVSKITDHRNMTMISVLGRFRAGGADDVEVAEQANRINEESVSPPLEEAELARLVANACKWPVGEPEPVVLIGGKPAQGAGVIVQAEPVDWHTHYHTFEQVSNAPRPRFLIDGFLQLQSITAIAAPVGQRKSIIGLNVAHCLCTREPLFDHFPANPECVPSRVLYLCPEMGLISFSDRVRNIGLMPHVCKSFFVRTMNPVQETPGKRPDTLTLEDLQEDEVKDAVVIIDTAVRFIQGDENSSADMRVFANSIFRLAEIGAAAVVVLFHSGKTTKEQPELTLENAMRGSGELGAFVTCCWATRLQLGEDEDEYRAKSYLRNVKPRDFEAKPFEVIGTRDAQDNVVNDCRMHWIDNGEAKVVLSQKAHGVKTDADGMEDLSVAVIKAHPEMKIRELQAAMKAAGIKKPRCPSWISTKRAELRGAGVHTE
jgi:hypothetical protein